jgi:dihydroorotate dehydrogenase
MYPLLRPFLFHLDPERAHKLTINLLRLTDAFSPIQALLSYLYGAHRHYNSPVNVFGLTFPNCVGLAAGFDKNGVAWSGLSTLGFGHIEVGTVTPRPQTGNPKPRVFRLIEDQAIVNRMGFPGKGADFVFKQLAQMPRSHASTILGVNIGKNKDTPIEEAVQDYCYLLEKFSPVADPS